MSKENNNTKSKTIIIGVDIHVTNLNVTFYDPETGLHNYETRLNAQDFLLVHYIKKMIKRHYSDGNYKFIIAYEAGYTGYETSRYLKKNGLDCIILAPNSIRRSPKEKKVKNDVLDARIIAETVASKQYTEVFVPGKKDESVRQVISLRKSIVENITRTKNQLLALLVQTGFNNYTDSANWSQQFFKDIVEFMEEEIEQDYTKFVITQLVEQFYTLKAELDSVDSLIEEIAQEEEYAPLVKLLCCFKGISTLIALALIINIGDINRFESAKCLAKYYGLVPGEHISNDKGYKTGITKTGNPYIRSLLILAAQTYCRGSEYYKSNQFLKNQEGLSPEMVEYSNRAFKRLHRKFRHLRDDLHKAHNVCVCAVARELCCFVYGALSSLII